MLLLMSLFSIIKLREEIDRKQEKNVFARLHKYACMHAFMYMYIYMYIHVYIRMQQQSLDRYKYFQNSVQLHVHVITPSYDQINNVTHFKILKLQYNIIRILILNMVTLSQLYYIIFGYKVYTLQYALESYMKEDAEELYQFPPY